jgi:histidinol phosphatase-like PHP family hydrolase
VGFVKTKKIVSLLLALFALLNIFSISVFATEKVSYTIKSPYETVDWDTFNQYKTQLHAHTLYSDGGMDVKDVVEEYYRQNYDILAITDHGVVNKGWDEMPEMLPIIGYNKLFYDLSPVSKERYEEITTGVGRDGRPMLDVNQGIEMNGVVMRKNHVNGFFCGAFQGDWGEEEDYISPIKATHEAGGISFIAHPGDFYSVNGNRERAEDYNYLKTFIEPLLEYDSCVGIEIFNERDTVAGADRILWDNVLMYTVPRGKVAWGFSNDDSHIIENIGVTAEIMLMPELSNEALRTAMENGTFFACSRIAKNEMGDEFEGNGNYAKIERIIVDEEQDIITVTANNYETIEWISDGEIIATGNTFNLRENSEKLGSYVRFQIKNEGGIVMSQPFVCDDGNMEAKIIEEPLQEPLNFFEKIVERIRKTILGELVYRMFCL